MLSGGHSDIVENSFLCKGLHKEPADAATVLTDLSQRAHNLYRNCWAEWWTCNIIIILVNSYVLTGWFSVSYIEPDSWS